MPVAVPRAQWRISIDLRSEKAHWRICMDNHFASWAAVLPEAFLPSVRTIAQLGEITRGPELFDCLYLFDFSLDHQRTFSQLSSTFSELHRRISTFYFAGFSESTWFGLTVLSNSSGDESEFSRRSPVKELVPWDKQKRGCQCHYDSDQKAKRNWHKGIPRSKVRHVANAPPEWTRRKVYSPSTIFL
jgi:hypothetical protein